MHLDGVADASEIARLVLGLIGELLHLTIFSLIMLPDQIILRHENPTRCL